MTPVKPKMSFSVASSFWDCQLLSTTKRTSFQCWCLKFQLQSYIVKVNTPRHPVIPPGRRFGVCLVCFGRSKYLGPGGVWMSRDFRKSGLPINFTGVEADDFRWRNWWWSSRSSWKKKHDRLVLSTHLKNIFQNGNLPQGSGWKYISQKFETATVDHLCPHFCPSNASSQAFAPVFMEHGLNQKNE